MYLGIIAFGTVHSLIFLPVLLSVIGPPLNKQRLMLMSDPHSAVGFFAHQSAVSSPASPPSSPLSPHFPDDVTDKLTSVTTSQPSVMQAHYRHKPDYESSPL